MPLAETGKFPLKVTARMEPDTKSGWGLSTNVAPLPLTKHAGRRADRNVVLSSDGRFSANKVTERFMQDAIKPNLTRRAILGALGATVISAAPFFPGVTAYARGAGDIRRLHFYSGRTGESMNVIYWIDGTYIPESLAEINHFFRDWRNNAVHNIDARTVDFLAATHNILRVNEPYMLLSGYRSPQTNAMLRARSRNVAQNSLHLRGQAADVRLRSRSVRQISQAAQSCNAGGVGRYSRSDFVHFDCGAVRSWGS